MSTNFFDFYTYPATVTHVSHTDSVDDPMTTEGVSCAVRFAAAAVEVETANFQSALQRSALDKPKIDHVSRAGASRFFTTIIGNPGAGGKGEKKITTVRLVAVQLQ
jgi:hypothetical protein